MLDSLAGVIDCVPPKGSRLILIAGRAEGGATEAITMVEGRHSAALTVATPGVAGVYTFTIRNRGGLKIVSARANVIGNEEKLAQVTAIDESAGTLTVAVLDDALEASTLADDEFVCLEVLLSVL